MINKQSLMSIVLCVVIMNIAGHAYADEAAMVSKATEEADDAPQEESLKSVLQKLINNQKLNYQEEKLLKNSLVGLGGALILCAAVPPGLGSLVHAVATIIGNTVVAFAGWYGSVELFKLSQTEKVQQSFREFFAQQKEFITAIAEKIRNGVRG